MKKNIGIFIDHDIIIRHFIKTNILNELNDKYNLIYFFPSKPNKRVSTNIENLNIDNYQFIKIDNKRHGKLQRFYHVKISYNLLPE